MPNVFVGGKVSFSVTIPKDDDFTFKQWTDKSLAKQRKQYNRPNLGLWFEIPNAKDKISPFAIPVNETEVYEGNFEVSQSGRTFTFIFDGKAKADVHKDTKAQIEKGKAPVLVRVSINGQGFAPDEPIPAELAIQLKKL